jgi:hypothetical protein
MLTLAGVAICTKAFAVLPDREYAILGGDDGVDSANNRG